MSDQQDAAAAAANSAFRSLITLASPYALGAWDIALWAGGKVWRSMAWTAAHISKVALAMAVAVILGILIGAFYPRHVNAAFEFAGLPPPGAISAPPTVTISMTKTEQTLNEIASRMAKLEQTVSTTQAKVVETQGNIAKIQDFTDHVPEMLGGMFVLGAAKPEAPAASPKPRPAPTVKTVKTAPIAPPAPPPAEQPAPSPLEMIKGWVK